MAIQSSTTSPGFFESLFGGSTLTDLLGAGGQIYNIEETAGRLTDFGTQANQAAQQIATQGQEATQFKPFSITSGTGGIGTTAEGGTNLTLSPQQQALQQSLFGTQGQIAGQLGQTDPRYAQLQAMGLGGAAGQFGQIAGAGSQFGGAQNQLMGLGSMFGQQAGMPTGLEGLSQQALFQGQMGLAQSGFNPLQGLQDRYTGLAGRATKGLMQDRAGREQDIYQSIRAMQSPEEERQRLALEQRLQAQGRGGVRTSQFGGTPEQLAQAKAQAEAQNQASFGAMSQASQEQQQDLQRALGLSGQAASLAGQGSQLQSAAQQRGMGLSQLGMQGLTTGQGIQSQYLQNALAGQQGAGQLAGLQQQLQQGQLGLTSGMFGLGQQAGLAPAQQQQAMLANLLGAQQAGFGGENQLLNQLQGTTNIASIADLGRRQGAGLFADTSLSGIEQQLSGELGAADIRSRYGEALTRLLGQAGQANQSNSGLLAAIGGLGEQLGGGLDDILGGIGGLFS